LKATFFILPDLSSFDAIVALDLLKQAGVSLCLASGHLKWGNEVEKVEFQSCPNVNFTNVDCSDAPPLARDAFVKILRLVLDFRKLNERTIPDRYPMQNISMILGNLGKARYFTTLDLKSGYHQITLAERDPEKTSFSVNRGKYEFRRLPFGLKNAASIFQRTIDDIPGEQNGKFCYVYVDDVIVFSEDVNAHIRHVNWVLKSLHDANMRVSAQKSAFFQKKLFGLHCH